MTTNDDDVILPAGSRIVHIGPPKTGTTALQSAFHGARAGTKRQGVEYASTGRHAMSAVLAAIDRPSPWAADGKPPPKWAWNRLLASIRSSNAARVVLSSEFFADAAPDAIRRVVEQLDPSRVHVVVTLRPLARIIPSQWQQFVQNQLTLPFDAWLDGQLNQPRGTVTPVFWRRHRHDELVARWAEVVGADRLTVVALDDRDRDMVLRVFERLTGLTAGTLVADTDLENRSMTVPEIEVVRAFNTEFKARNLPAPLYGRIMRFGAAEAMKQRDPAPDEPRLELPAWSVQPIANIAREMVASIGASGVRVVGDLDLLTAVPEGRPRATRPVAVSPAVAASAAIGVLVASGLARGTGSISADESDALAGGETQSGVARPTGGDRAPRPVQEPSELLRITTVQLGVVIARRWRVAIADRVARAVGRRHDS